MTVRVQLGSKMISDEYPSSCGTSTRSTSPTATTGRRRQHTCVDCSKGVLPHAIVCYGQVESPYGSGQFIKDGTEHFDDGRAVVTSESREGRDHGLIKSSWKGPLGMNAISESRPTARLPGDVETTQGLRAQLLPDLQSLTTRR